ncbi:MAG: hypothetical protein SFU86_10425 [Pirellulaceae bacterium]|nr:hypothetical protein [Pirellulaceae bacterium]
MFLTYPATIDDAGVLRLDAGAALPASRKALVVILDESAPPVTNETGFLSEAALGVDWNRPEEDAAWAHLQPGK